MKESVHAEQFLYVKHALQYANGYAVKSRKIKEHTKPNQYKVLKTYVINEASFKNACAALSVSFNFFTATGFP